MFILKQVGQNKWINSYMVGQITLLSWNLNFVGVFFFPRMSTNVGVQRQEKVE
jgi:hypothetical protein